MTGNRSNSTSNHLHERQKQKIHVHVHGLNLYKTRKHRDNSLGAHVRTQTKLKFTSNEALWLIQGDSIVYFNTVLLIPVLYTVLTSVC